MHAINNYTPPNTEDLQRLKNELGLTGVHMAQLAALGGSHQWRKYTGGKEPRSMNVHMLFFIAAQLHMTADQREMLFEKMREIGAVFDAAEN